MIKSGKQAEKGYSCKKILPIQTRNSPAQQKLQFQNRRAGKQDPGLQVSRVYKNEDEHKIERVCAMALVINCCCSSIESEF